MVSNEMNLLVSVSLFSMVRTHDQTNYIISKVDCVDVSRGIKWTENCLI